MLDTGVVSRKCPGQDHTNCLVRVSPGGQLRLADFAQLIHLGDLSGDRTLHHLGLELGAVLNILGYLFLTSIPRLIGLLLEIAYVTVFEVILITPILGSFSLPSCVPSLKSPSQVLSAGE